jgi:cytidylate kinase
VIVGRCADYVLRDLRNVVNVFVTASLEFRISNVANKQNISRDEALKVIEHGEKARAEYYNYYTGKQWGHATSYDLCIDSSQLGLLDTEKFIAEFVRRRFGIHK